MTCPNCKKEDPHGREMCPDCGAPIKPIPVPPGGKIRFGKYDWYVLDKQELFIEENADVLVTLLEVAKIQSTGSSNRIEGIYTTDKRLEELVRQKSAPLNRSEEEIAGYRDVLSNIHESYDYIYPRPNIILQLHRQLYSYSKTSIGGSYKNSDNYIAEKDSGGDETVRFQPVPAFLTAGAMDDACNAFIKELEQACMTSFSLSLCSSLTFSVFIPSMMGTDA